MNLVRPLIIFSVPASELASTKISLDVEHIDWMDVQGCWKGQKESSIAIPWSADNEELVQEICQLWRENCYLVQDANRYGYLHHSDGTFMAELGQLRYITKTEAESRDNWSSVSIGKHHITGEEDRRYFVYGE